MAMKTYSCSDAIKCNPGFDPLAAAAEFVARESRDSSLDLSRTLGHACWAGDDSHAWNTNVD
jgi:hypothetical protein